MEKPVFPPEYYASGIQKSSKKRKERSKVKRKCDVCGKTYMADETSVKKGIGLCCSSECKTKLNKIKSNEVQETTSET